MPDNRAEPTHRLMVEVAEDPRWAARLAHMSRAHLPAVGAYYDAMAPLAARFDIWRTAYQHPLADPAAIVDFVRGTGLRPFLDALDEGERAAFVADYTARIAAAYPPRADG
jgi:trans-aconitate 2-methyltransferase